MGYPNFGKVKTITLPYEEDMTASQYLDRYGIDLATIELYDLINIALDDVVYPVLYIDKENKVLFMADRAYSYDGGLSVVNNSLINVVLATGTVTNAKPIYYHGVELISYTAKNVAEIAILNNSPDPINSIAKFKAWAESIPQDLVIVKVDGCVKLSDTVYHLYAILKVKTGDTIQYKFAYLDTDGYDVTAAVDLDDYFESENTADGVNKIN